MLYSQADNQKVRPSDLIGCSDPTTAYVLNRCAWRWGTFIENETTRFRYASKPGTSKDKQSSPTDNEVDEYRRALIEGTPYRKASIRKKKQRSLADIGRRSGKPTALGRKIVQEPGGRMRVEE